MAYISKDQQIPRLKYEGIDVISQKTNNVKKQDFNHFIKKNIWTLPLNLAGIIMVGSSCIGFIYFSKKIKEQAKNKKISEREEMMYSSLIGMANGIIIFICGVVYEGLAYLVVNYENHEFWNDWENSMIYKNFLFQFLNSYFVLFYFAYYDSDYDYVATNI